MREQPLDISEKFSVLRTLAEKDVRDPIRRD
jgi:hypothetical protein